MTSLHALEVFIQDQRIEHVGRRLQRLDRGHEGRVGLVHRTQQGQHVGHIVEHFAQVATELVNLLQGDPRAETERLRDRPGQRLERVEAGAGDAGSGDRVGCLTQAIDKPAGRPLATELINQFGGGVDKGLHIGHAVSPRAFRRQGVLRFDGRVLGGERLEHPDVVRTHRMTGKIVSTLHFTAQAPPSGLNPAQQGRLEPPGQIECRPGIAAVEFVLPVPGL